MLPSRLRSGTPDFKPEIICRAVVETGQGWRTSGLWLTGEAWFADQAEELGAA